MNITEAIESLQEVKDVHGECEVRAFYYDEVNNKNIDTYLHSMSFEDNKIYLEMEKANE